MAWEFPADPDVSLAGLQAVNGADVVQASASDVVPRRGVSTGHHPGRPQGDGVYLGGERMGVFLEKRTRPLKPPR